MDEENERTPEEESSQEMMSVSELGPRSRKVNLKVKVIEMNEPREVTSRRDNSTNRVTEALVGDDTGAIYLTLWNEDIDKIKIDSSIRINNAYCNVFKNSLRLNIGRYGSFEEIEEDITANTENNLSNKVYEQPPRFRRDSRRPQYGGFDRQGGDRYGGGRSGGGRGRGGYSRRRDY
jgi:replication factor A1